jgi:hypothetical protein
VVIHVVADAAALEGAPHAEVSGDGARCETAAETPSPSAAAFLVGGGIIPNPLLAELIRGGATIRPVRHPGDAPAELRYRPSTALDEFARCRDLTCRFPCCDAPAEFCDIDHTVPYPLGPTHPSNLKCLCRKQDGLMTLLPCRQAGDVGVWGPGLAGSRNQLSRVGADQPDADRGRGPAA